MLHKAQRHKTRVKHSTKAKTHKASHKTTATRSTRHLTTATTTPTKAHWTIDQYNQKRGTAELAYDDDCLVQGWVRSIRKQGKVAFLALNDGSNTTGVQAIVDPIWTNDATLSLIENYNIPQGSALKVYGKVVRNLRKEETAPDGWEVQAIHVDVEGVCDTHGFLSAAALAKAKNETGEDAAKADKKAKKNKKKLSPEELTAFEAEEKAKQAAEQAKIDADREEYDLSPYPLQKKFQTLDFLRQHPDTRLRTNTYAAIQRVRSAAMIGFHNHFAQDGFVCVQPPIITPSDCEGGGEMFQLERSDKISLDSTSTTTTPTTTDNKANFFFHRPAFLSVSGQLYAEIAASSLRRVYSFGPTFRAESSHTSRHLAEFWMLEPEMAFATLDELTAACEASIQGTIKSLLDNPTILEDLKFFQGRYDKELIPRLEAVSKTPFGRITYTAAMELLQQHVAEGKVSFSHTDLSWGADLATEHEKYLAEVVFQKPVFVTNYPAKIKSFYMKIDDESIQPIIDQHKDDANTLITLPRDKSISTSLDAWAGYTQRTQQEGASLKNLLQVPQLDSANVDTSRMTVSCFDLLVPGMGELCGGSQREERVEVLLQRVKENGLKMEDYQWYVDLRRFGTTQHGGWGMGFERFVAYATGVDNVRDTTLVPRAAGVMQI